MCQGVLVESQGKQFKARGKSGINEELIISFSHVNWEMVSLKSGKELEEKGKERCLYWFMLYE